VGTRLLIAGGSLEDGTASRSVYEFAPSRGGVVRRVGSLPAPTTHAAAATLGSVAYVIGGRGAVLGPPTARIGAIAQAGRARRARSLVYVPNSGSDTVDVIDPHTYRIVDHFDVGGLPQHVVPAWDLKTLYVTNDTGNSLTPIDPRTGKPGAPIPVADPYNMYFTPDGRYAIVVAERL